MKRNDVFIRAEKFFREYIDDEYKKVMTHWSCWETAALALISIHLQQTKKEVSFKNIFNRCRYRELVKIAAVFAQCEYYDDVKTILHVCEDRAAHRLFFSVVKKCFENKNGYIPYFGEITEDELTEEQKLKEAENRGWHISYDYAVKSFKKRIYKCAAVSFFTGALVSVMWAVEYFKNF